MGHEAFSGWWALLSLGAGGLWAREGSQGAPRGLDYGQPAPWVAPQQSQMGPTMAEQALALPFPQPLPPAHTALQRALLGQVNHSCEHRHWGTWAQSSHISGAVAWKREQHSGGQARALREAGFSFL